MEVLFDVTDNFEKDLEDFSQVDQKVIEKKINFYAQVFRKNQFAIHIYSHKFLLPVNLPVGFTPSLYVLRINSDIRLIATFDNDPLYNQIIITLLGCVRHQNYEKSINKIFKSLYEKEGNDFMSEESNDTN